MARLTRIFRLGLCWGLILLTLVIGLEPRPGGIGLAATATAEGDGLAGAGERLLDPGRPYLALTFDDGPSADITPQLAAGLAERGALATFFVLGCQAEQQPELVAAIAEAGHEVASHGYDHKRSFTRMDDAELAAELAATSAIIQEITGSPPLYVRPPYGNIDLDTAAKINSPLMLWNIDPRDWEAKSPAALCRYIVEHAFNGGVVILHDEFPNTLQGVLDAVTTLQAAGWQFVTLSEYYQLAGMEPQAGIAYRGRGVADLD